MRPFHRTLGVTLLGLGVFAGLAPAQEPVRPQTKPGSGANPPGHSTNLDQHFATCLILDNQNEIAVSQLAKQRSESPEVKRFAEMMEKEHQEFVAELERFAGSQRPNRRQITSPTGATRQDARTEPGRSAEPDRSSPPGLAERPTTGTTPSSNRSGPASTAGNTDDKLLQVKHEIADECLASAQRDLSDKQGREFDACYIGMQLGAHMHMIDELKVLERHASPELQGTLRKGRETAQKHLDHAKKIMKDIDEKKTRTASN